MGIKGLFKLCSKYAPKAIIKNRIGAYKGTSLAVDASICIYQYLSAIRTHTGETLRNGRGEPTSHLAGIFRRSIKLLEYGIEPVYVFDGEAPDMKRHEHMKREARRDQIRKNLEDAVERDDQDAIKSISKMGIKMTKEQKEQCINLLRLMGIAVVISPGEAEAQCSGMAKDGLVFGVASEDMDTLAFGSPKLLKNLVSNKGGNDQVIEIRLEKVLDGFGLSMSQFIDLCILLGCDYCHKISGIGPETALRFIKEYKNIEAIIAYIEKNGKGRYIVPESWDYKRARALFVSPLITIVGFDNEAPKEEEIIRFLVDENQFSLSHVREGIKKLVEVRSKPRQKRVEDFFSCR